MEPGVSKKKRSVSRETFPPVKLENLLCTLLIEWMDDI